MKMIAMRPRLLTVAVFSLTLSTVVGFYFHQKSEAEPRPEPVIAPSITATKALVFPAGAGGDIDGDGNADPGDTITYTVTVNNTAAPGPGNDATGVVITDILANTTTLVGLSVNAGPIAGNDAFAVTGNIGISVPDGASDLLANDFDPDTGSGSGLTMVTTTATSANCVPASCPANNVAISANGSFTYNPPPGFEGTDTFTYTIRDNGPDGIGGNADDTTATGIVTLTVGGMVWFVNNGAPACTTLAGGCGRLSNPFSALSALQSINNGAGNNPAASDNIFVFESASPYPGGVILLSGQRLIGQDSTSTLANITGITLPTFSTAFPTMNTAAPATTIQNTAGGNGVVLGTGNSLNGFTASNSTVASISGTNFGTVTVDSVIVDTIGQAVNLSTGAVAGSGFPSIASDGGASGISLNAISGTLLIGVVSIDGQTGDGINITNSPSTVTINGGSITDSGENAVEVNGSNGNVTIAAELAKESAGKIVLVTARTGNTVTLSGNISATGGVDNGIDVRNNTAGITNFTGQNQLISTAENPAVNLFTNGTGVINFAPAAGGNGLDITTTDGLGFRADTGGTITVQGVGNTITSLAGGALRVVNATIGSPNMTFQSISSNGAVNGIFLNSTGTSGGLIIAGNGGICDSLVTCTGGAIRDSAGDGVVLNTTINPSLTRLAVVNNNDSGIFADAVSGLSISDSFIFGNGDESEGGAIQDCNVHIEDLIGSGNAITNTTISDSRNTNLDWNPNTSSSMSTLTVTNSNLNHAGGGFIGEGNAGINLVATGTANVKLVVTGGQIVNNSMAGVLVTGGAGTRVQTDISGVDMINGAPPSPMTTGMCDPQPGNWGNGSGTNFGIHITSTETSNQIHRIDDVHLAFTGIAQCDLSFAPAIGFQPTGSGTFDITITNSTIGIPGSTRSGNENSFGIAGDIQGSVVAKVNVSGNTVRHTALNGINIQTRESSPPVDGHVAADLTLRDNTVDPLSDLDADDGPVGGGQGGPVQTIGTRLDSRNDSDLCLDISSNTSTGFEGNEGFEVTQANTSTYRLERATPADVASSAAAASFIAAQNDPGSTARATQSSSFTAVPDGTCQSPQTPLASEKGEVAFLTDGNREFFLNTATLASFVNIDALETQLAERGVMAPNPEVEVAYAVVENRKPGPSVFAAFLNRLSQMISPTVYSQEKSDAVPESGETITINGSGLGFTLPAQKSIVVTLKATVNSGPHDSGVNNITNQATVTAAGGISVNTNITSIALDAAPDLTVSVSDGGGTTQPGGVIQYATTYSNLSGANSQNAGSVRVSQTVPANTTFNATVSSAGWSCPNNSAAGTVCTFDVGAVNAGSTPASVNFAVNVLPLLPASAIQISDTATIAENPINANGTDRDLKNNTSTDATNIIGNWDGSTSSDWHVASNWSNNVVPPAGLSVSIPNVANAPSIISSDVLVNLLSLNSNLSIGDLRTLTASGNVTLNTFQVDGPGTLELGTLSSIAHGAGGQVNATLKKNFSGPGPTFEMPVGTTGAFSPLNVTVTNGAGQLTARANTGVPVPTPPGVDPTRTLQRYWTLSGSGIRSNITFSYLNSDVPGPPNDESLWGILRITGATSVGYPDSLPNVVMDATNNRFTIDGVESYSHWTAGAILAPTAANATISGRVVDTDGRGIFGAKIAIQSQQGDVIWATTNPFGYYRFMNVEVGHVYLISPQHKRFTFQSRTITVSDDVVGVDFTAEP